MAKDRRYQKTKNAIYKTFVKLLTEKEFRSNYEKYGNT